MTAESICTKQYVCAWSIFAKVMKEAGESGSPLGRRVTISLYP
jgi:hypothetical protein